MSLVEDVSRQIKAAREAKRWSQEELAKRCGVKKPQISKIESDIRRCSMKLFLKVCEEFGLTIILLDEALELVAEENVTYYITELGKPVEERELLNVDIGKALDSVIRYTLTNLRIDYSYGNQDYDYRFNIGNKTILLSWKMGNLRSDEYRDNCLAEVRRSLVDPDVHEFIITIPDYPAIAEEMNNRRYIDKLMFVPINNLSKRLQDILEIEKS